MADERKRQRTESMIKLVSQKKESKLWYEEANSHIKLGNLSKAIYSYNKILSNMAEVTFSHHRLSVSREAELLQSFVRGQSDAEKMLQKQPEAVKKPEEAPPETEIKSGEEKQPGEEPPPEEKVEEPKKKGKKRRKRGARREELYCDKDRAAAVNLGSKDIKQSLKLKRKMDRTRALQIPEEAEPSTFVALGNYELYRGEMEIAAKFMTKALELNPAEKSALVARSKCYILMGQPENALKDAETALNVDKSYLKAIYQKAEALYYLGDFEHSLMYYHRGLHIRPDHEDFKLGVHKAQKAIENAIGSSNVFSRILTPKISSRGDKSTSKTGEGEETTETSTSKTSGKIGSRRAITPGARSKSGRQSRLLRELGPDKEYLDKLMKNPNLKCKFNSDESNIVKTIEETVDYLNARQEFWRQQLPHHLK